MKSIIIAAAAVSALSGAAQAASNMTDIQFLQAARCRGLAASEGLGRLDTAAIDQLLRTEGQARELGIRASATNKINAATTQGDKAQGAKKEKLLAEREQACAAWLQGAP